MPPQADNFDELYDLRGLMEKGFAGSLDADLSKYTRLNAIVYQKDRPRYEITITVGAPLGHRKLFPNRGPRFDMFNFTASVAVISAPNPDPAQNGFHPQLVARADTFTSGLQYNSQEDYENFPFISILYIRGEGIDPALKPEDGVERSTLNYSGHFGIRNTAWPT